MFLLLCCLIAADPEPQKNFQIQAEGSYPWTKHLGAKNLAIRNADELVAASTHALSRASNEVRRTNATRELCAALKIKDIDWNKQMVLVASLGELSTGGYSITISGAKLDKGVLKVSYKSKSPGPDEPVTQAITYPSHVVLVPMHKGKIVFVEEK